MRIYAVADVHARPERIDRIRHNMNQYSPDVLVVAGDVTGFFHPARTLARLNRLPVPVLMIRGNTDLKRVERLIGFYENIHSLHLKQMVIEGVAFAGLSGTVPVPFRSRVGLREKSLVTRARRLVDKGSVFVVHPPPYGILDAVMGKYAAGSRAVYELILQKQPRLVLCGHIHEAFGCRQLAGSWVVNCNMAGGRHGVIVDMGAGGRPGIRMLEADGTEVFS